MTGLIALLLTAPPAQAGLIDDYAARPDWACAYGRETVSCGGPDSWVGIDAAHTVVICGENEESRICGETWRLSGEPEVIAPVVETWGGQLEAELGNKNWVLTPAQQPDSWLAALRDPRTLGALEVGRNHVQARLEERTPCAGRSVGEALDPYVEPILPEVEGGDRVALALELPWDEAKTIAVGPISPQMVAGIFARPSRERYDKGMLQRWTLLASEPFQCVAESRKERDARALLPVVLDEWRRATAPTPAERKIQKAREREQARLARKNHGVETGEETLTDDVQDRSPDPAPETGLDKVDVGDLLGEDDPADE